MCGRFGTAAPLCFNPARVGSSESKPDADEIDSSWGDDVDSSWDDDEDDDSVDAGWDDEGAASEGPGSAPGAS